MSEIKDLIKVVILLLLLIIAFVYALVVPYNVYAEQINYNCKHSRENAPVRFYCDKTDYFSFIKYGPTYYVIYRATTGEN